MNRRDFLKGLGVGTEAFTISGLISEELPQTIPIQHSEIDKSLARKMLLIDSVDGLGSFARYELNPVIKPYVVQRDSTIK
jgi:hypothetical protein